ncbi:hypothetical protein DSM104299_00861 [Baekduia alba]|nr:hypothetical protein DSM104299_00861 [Baekduia alba]
MACLGGAGKAGRRGSGCGGPAALGLLRCCMRGSLQCCAIRSGPSATKAIKKTLGRGRVKAPVTLTAGAKATRTTTLKR